MDAQLPDSCCGGRVDVAVRRGAARLLIRPGYGYGTAVQWFQPYDRRLKPFPEGLAAAARLTREASAAGVGPLFVYVGNKLEGSAPLSAAALAEALERESPA